MKRSAQVWTAFIGLSILTLTVFASIMQTAHADSLTHLQHTLPKRIGNWTAESEDRYYDAKSIFDYIDGAGEVYRAYNMRQCFSRRYVSRTDPTIVLDIFDMGSSVDAFGVFTHDTDGKVIVLGQDARLKPGWLSFWKDRFFVSIYMEEQTPAAEKAVMALGDKVDGQIRSHGARPRILARLPGDGLDSGRIRYLHHPIVLNYHYYLADENILSISDQTHTVLAEYKRNHQEARLLLVQYPDSTSAQEAMSGFLRHYLPDADSSHMALLESGKWAAVQMKDSLLAVVLESDTRPLARHLLAEVFD
jgi:hypothetical protein